MKIRNGLCSRRLPYGRIEKPKRIREKRGDKSIKKSEKDIEKIKETEALSDEELDNVAAGELGMRELLVEHYGYEYVATFTVPGKPCERCGGTSGDLYRQTRCPSTFSILCSNCGTERMCGI